MIIGPDCTCLGREEKAGDCSARKADLLILSASGPGEIARYSPYCRYTQAILGPKRERYADIEATRVMIWGGFPREMAKGARLSDLPPELLKWDHPKILFLTGRPGVGKTWAAAALIRRELGEAILKGPLCSYPTAFVYAPDVPPFSRVYDLPWIGADLLLIDDLPLYDAHRAPLWQSICDFRYRNGLGMLITANTEAIALSSIAPSWRPVLSRLFDGERSLAIELSGADRRLRTS
ncbi:MAG: hypothetical protein ABIM59_05065 [candidate division WOR-3 bacterium]